MSQHPIPIASDSPQLRDQFAAAFGASRLVNVTANGQSAGQVAYVANPDLSAGEATTFADLVAAAGATIVLQPADYAVIKAQYATVKAFVTNGSPTNADIIAAVKAIGRVLGAILRQ